MIIGIVGSQGIVGEALAAGFNRLDFTVICHDILINTRLIDVLTTEIVYICVPTPSNDDGSCNTSIVESVVDELYKLKYSGVIAIKSTIEPGTTQRLIDKHNDQIVFVPEFLKERSAKYDFVFNHRLLLVGTNNVNYYYLVQRSHGQYPKDSMRVTPVESEMMKYYWNTFNATRITFANVLYEICQSNGAEYDRVKEAFLRSSDMPDEYLDVKPELRGYGGACLPKDVLAMNNACKKLGIPNKLFEYIDKENKLFKKTVFKGMRK
ncbi:MAG: hypothetical protein CL489_04980 [Acidobacteria bacterium]|nr:hypothetical protein [Acidobacteriota bacterium]